MALQQLIIDDDGSVGGGRKNLDQQPTMDNDGTKTFPNSLNEDHMPGELPSLSEVRKWNDIQVADWLKQIGLSSDCINAFQQRQLDGASLLDLSDDSRSLDQMPTSHRRQLTKYINQCKEKDLTIKNAKKKLLAIAQNRLQTPPSPPQKDYVGPWDSADDDSEKSWGSDFDDDEDVDGSSEMNGYCDSKETHVCDDSGHDGKWPSDDVSPCLPPQPQIPRRKPKVMNSSPAKDDSSPSENGTSESKSPRKPPVANKPSVKPKPATLGSGGVKSNKSTPIGTGSVLPRPPSGLPTKPVRTSLTRPTQQPPPPPPNKPRLPELIGDSELSPGEEYEVPVTCVAGGESEAATLKLSSAISSGQNAMDVGSNSSNEGSSSSTSVTSDLPLLPPRHSPRLAVAPPLPRKPSISTLTRLVDSPSPVTVRAYEKPVLLPTKKSDDNGIKSKENQLKGFGSLFLKNKLTTLLLSDKSSGVSKAGSSKTDSSSSHSGSRASSPEHSASLSNLCQEMQPLTIKRTRSQEPLGTRDNRLRGSGHRTSLDDGTSMQNRPLPPVPDGQRRPSAPAACNNIPQQEDLQNCPWFHDVERNSAEVLLQQSVHSGSYLVRPSRRAGESSPYTLNITYEGKVFHLNIRWRSDAVFALGKEKLNEKTFDTVEDLIRYHQVEPILLTSKGEAAGRTRLLFTPQKR